MGNFTGHPRLPHHSFVVGTIQHCFLVFGPLLYTADGTGVFFFFVVIRVCKSWTFIVAALFFWLVRLVRYLRLVGVVGGLRTETRGNAPKQEHSQQCSR